MFILLDDIKENNDSADESFKTFEFDEWNKGHLIKGEIAIMLGSIHIK